MSAHLSIVQGEKGCNKCCRILPISSFAKNQSYKSGLSGHCRECQSLVAKRPDQIEKRKEWAANNPDKKAHINRRLHVKRSYGLSESEFIKQHFERKGCCDICSKQCSLGALHDLSVPCDLTVDHNHNTQKFRGLLCQKCNTGLGQFQDDIRILKVAMKYLLER